MGATASAAQNPSDYSYLPPGLKASDWDKIEHHLSGELEEAKLTAGDAQADDDFGFSVAISGDTVIVGAHWEDGGPGDPLYNAGAAYIYERDQGGANNWGQVAKLTAGDAQADDHFGYSVAISGVTVIVGAEEEDGGPGDPLPDAGAAYIFERDQGGANNWSQVAKLTAGDAQADDHFGYSVAISGVTVIVGAEEEDGGPGDPLPYAGAAYIFERDQGGANNWGQVAKLTVSDTQAGDYFGESVAISGDTVVVGAYGEDGGPGDPLPWAGAAYIFERDQDWTNNWDQVAKLTAGDAQVSDYFGNSVAISDDTVVVGAHGEDGGQGDPLPYAGAAYIFERDQGGANNWGQIVKLTASDAQAWDDFGRSVAISGDTVVVGAWMEDGGPGNPLPSAGATYIFERDQGGANNWGQLAKLTASDAQAVDFFGQSVAISGDTVVVGAFGKDGPGYPLPDTGAAYVFTGKFEVPTDVTISSLGQPVTIDGGLLWVLGLLAVLMVLVFRRKMFTVGRID